MGDLGEFLLAVFGSWIEKVGIVLTIIPFVENIPSIRAWLLDKPILAGCGKTTVRPKMLARFHDLCG